MNKLSIRKSIRLKEHDYPMPGYLFLLVDRYGDASFGFKMALNSLIHSFSQTAGNPNFSALITSKNNHVFKKVKMVFNQTVNRHFFAVDFAAADCAQRIFHNIFSLRVLGSSHLEGSNQWTVII